MNTYKKGAYMDYSVTITTLPEKNYLVIKGFIELGGNTPDSYIEGEKILIGLIDNGMIDRLKKLSGSKEVYTLFCNTCILDEKTGGYICGYDIACENNNNVQAGDGFESLYLHNSEYAFFDCTFNCEMTKVQANKKIDDIYWGEWLKNNPYESNIETTTGANILGIAVISIMEPLDPNIKEFRIKTWYPIKKKK